MSRAIGVHKAQTYFERDFANQASISYYSVNHTQLGRWHGELATELGLIGVVEEKQFRHLADGRDPNAKYDPEDLKGWIHRKDGSYTLRDKQYQEVARVWQEGRYWHRSDAEGIYSTALAAQKAAHYEAVGQWIEHRNTVDQKTGKAMGHRAGVDIVFNWHKSISVTAIHDPRIYEVEQRAVKAGLAAMQEYCMVHMGGDEKWQQTAKWAVAIFQHTTARPEKVEIAPGKITDYSAPHLHTHAFWINLARDQEGKFRAVEPGFMYHAQRFGAAVAGAEMAYELKRLGYDVQQDKTTQTHAPMIAGYTDEYLKAESPRSQQIKKKTAEIGYQGRRRAEEIVAHQYRNEKLEKPPEEIKQDHLKIAAQYGNQQERIIADRDERRVHPSPDRTWDAAVALTHAKESLSIRTDVFTERDLLTKALHIGQGYVRLPELRDELTRRSQSNRDFEEGISKEFIQARHAMEPNEPGMRWTTQGAKDKERQVIQLTLAGQNTVEPILRTETTTEGIQQRFAHLNKGKGITGEQAQAVLEIVTSPDKVYGLQGVAGGGKCLAKGTPILLHCGCVKPVENIREGDLLMGPDSLPRRVLSLAHGFDQMYEVIPKKGESYTVNSCHVLSLRPTNRFYKRRKDSSRKLRNGCGEILNIAIGDFLSASNRIRKEAKGWRTGVEFPAKPITIDPYFLGLWLGDGSASGASIATKDPEVVEFLGGYAHNLGLQLKKTNQSDVNKCPQYQLTRGSGVRPHDGLRNPLHELMRDLRLIDRHAGRHTGEHKGCKHIPVAYKTNCRSVRLQVLAGIVDTDGSNHNNTYDVITKSRRLADDILFLARSLGFAAYLQPCIKRCRNAKNPNHKGLYFRINISGNVCEIPVRIARKQTEARKQVKDVLRTGITVKPVGIGEYFGFELDGDGLFLLGDFTVTHNTSSVLSPVRELAEEAGFEVIGLAPTGKARQELEKAGIRHTMTLQKYLKVTEGYLEKKGINPERPRYFIVDEQSMVSSQQDLEFLRSVVRSKRPRDRVLEAGDLRQHESVEAGRIFEEQMQAGMRFSSVNTILRQQTEDYRRVVEYFQVEKPHLALMKLEEMGWITETPLVAERQKALAQRYASDPENHIAATPFNQTRQELNEAIREALQSAGKLSTDVIRNTTVYVQRQDLTSADLKLAMNYQRGNVLVFHQNVTVEDAIGRSYRIERGQYGEVVNRSSDPKRQWLEVALYGDNKTVRYDPMELPKVGVYEKQKRHFAVGEKIVLKNPYKGLENGSRLTITQAETNGNIVAKEERSNRTLAFNVKDNPHLEYGYTYTSQAIQGGTTKTVLWDLPTAEKGASAAFTNALGYVSSSRGTHEVHLFTDDLQRAMTLLTNPKVKAKALNDEEIFEYKRKTQQPPEPALTSLPRTIDPKTVAVRI